MPGKRVAGPAREAFQFQVQVDRSERRQVNGERGAVHGLAALRGGAVHGVAAAVPDGALHALFLGMGKVHVPNLVLAEGAGLDDYGAGLVGAQVDERQGGAVGAQSGDQRGDVGRETGALPLRVEVAHLSA